MPVEQLPITTHFDVQRFKQFSPQDCANWYRSLDNEGKRPVALYPAMGRKHISTGGLNRLIFGTEARGLFKTVNKAYAVVASNIFLINQDFSVTIISDATFTGNSGFISFAYLPTPATTFAVFADGSGLWVYDEVAALFYKVTDTKLPVNPTYVGAFGNRIVVAGRDTPQFNLSVINLGVYPFDPATCFTIDGGAVFAQEAGNIKSFVVLHNTLYIFCDFTTGIWSNTPSTFQTTTFPWRKNTSNDWDYGLADPLSIDSDFGMIVFLAQNRNGLVQVMASKGATPERISTKAVDVVFERDQVNDELSPFLLGNANGFLYVYENTIFYRLSAGTYTGTQLLNITDLSNSLEYNFDSQTWGRCIELNSERNRIQKHVYFNYRHLVTVQNDNTIYEMSGRFYTNEIRNPDIINPQSPDAYISDPMRYEAITQIISDPDYSQSSYEYVEIDFVWGESKNIRIDGAFPNAVFIIDEEPEPTFIITDDSTNNDPVFVIDENLDQSNEPIFLIDNQPNPDGDIVFIRTDDSPANDPVLLVTEDSDFVTRDDVVYDNIFRPHIELYYSDNGGQMFYPASPLQFSDLGFYRWRMRWEELGTSRNRVFKLICVSTSPIVVLGAVMNRKRVSGGAN